ncbi:hypothetical protein BKA67DRAFT_663193 [Truncatella angustata]|uniref:Uncharacterized protein n=1 Tax=Truncatella angustata TaxID=152316 RepID=A0A9P8RIS5_9PEZI|nr:uncharacterized protein BKA67DRAFT_663193 [Truncatella angustata]KAH6646809.1 hypothetical protein BKA67DRAFT_663193 [Truncatella angustata]
MNGFRFEIKRHHDFRITGNPPDKRIPLQWVDKSHFNEEAMFNGGLYKLDYSPVYGFEASAYKIKAPEKSLNAANDSTKSGTKIKQRNCQTWIVESADRLVKIVSSIWTLLLTFMPLSSECL